MNVKLQWYRVKEGRVDLPLGAQIIEVRFADTVGTGGSLTNLDDAPLESRLVRPCVFVWAQAHHTTPS